METLIVIILTVLAGVFVPHGAQADFLTRDNGEVCEVPEQYNAAPFDATFNLFGLSVEGCGFPWQELTRAIAEAQPDPVGPPVEALDAPLCEDAAINLGTACYAKVVRCDGFSPALEGCIDLP